MEKNETPLLALAVKGVGDELDDIITQLQANKEAIWPWEEAKKFGEKWGGSEVLFNVIRRKLQNSSMELDSYSDLENKILVIKWTPQKEIVITTRDKE